MPWEKHFSKTHKKDYWFNTKTGESVWKEPKELADVEQVTKQVEKLDITEKKVALLFLTFNEIKHVGDAYFNHCNIYIHPKNKEEVKGDQKKYVIKNLVETKWGDDSIVKATLNLLDEALKNPDNEWFVLLSQDAYPVHKSPEKMIDYLSKSDKSIFDINPYDPTKASQWWALTRKDAQKIVNLKESEKWVKPSHLDGAPDEFYFLHPLGKPHVTNSKFTYVEWIRPEKKEAIIYKHPVTFNKLMKCDSDEIEKANSFFIRKTTDSFKYEVVDDERSLSFVFIGDKTPQETVKKSMGGNVILIKMSDELIIDKEILGHCVKVYSIHWRFLDNMVVYLKRKYAKFDTKFYDEAFKLIDVADAKYADYFIKPQFQPRQYEKSNQPTRPPSYEKSNRPPSNQQSNITQKRGMVFPVPKNPTAKGFAKKTAKGLKSRRRSQFTLRKRTPRRR